MMDAQVEGALRCSEVGGAVVCGKVKVTNILKSQTENYFFHVKINNGGEKRRPW
jgi:hypothetical protein